MSTIQAPADPRAIAALLRRLSPAYAPTPLRDLPRLARALGVAQILAKDESRRALGSFKALGGTYAGLRALARVACCDVAALLDPATRPSGLPPLLCASDGNHGLAVAAAARHAGSSAHVFLHDGVPAARARRIEGEGGTVIRCKGTYDDTVEHAAAAARAGEGILVADTSDAPDDPVIADVMAGYGVMAAEIRDQAAEAGHGAPGHLFVQAGVGGLAAAMAAGLQSWMAAPGLVIAVEPESAACLGPALERGAPVRIPGGLETAADMLACGEASAPALAILRRHGVRALAVTEAALADAPGCLSAHGGPATTPSGAAGLAGLRALIEGGQAARFGLEPSSRVLLLVTEGDGPSAPG